MPLLQLIIHERCENYFFHSLTESVIFFGKSCGENNRRQQFIGNRKLYMA